MRLRVRIYRRLRYEPILAGHAAGTALGTFPGQWSVRASFMSWSSQYVAGGWSLMALH